MSLVLQVIVVALIVAACAVYSIWRLLSGAAQQRALARLSVIPLVARSGWFSALHERTRARSAGGCGSCASSASAASPKRTPGAPHR